MTFCRGLGLVLCLSMASGCDRLYVGPDEALKYYDRDGDGYVVAQGAAFGAEPPYDCLDSDARVNPAATEMCNSVDDDCNGVVDDTPADGILWYRDADDDGWGVADDSIVACEAAVGYGAGRSGDCDDTRSTAYPGALELCNDEDDDCDNDVDDDATDQVAWYLDNDGDGFGDVGSYACDAPDDDHVPVGGDCDDANLDIHPDATEVCESGLDEDCDGRDLGCGITGVESAEDAPALFKTIEAGANFGTSVAIGDLDGDGFDELAIGGAGVDELKGRVWLYYGGPVPPSGALYVDATANASFSGIDLWGSAGASIAFVGDLNADGRDDLTVGAPQPGGTGAVYIVYGSTDRIVGSMSLADYPKMGGVGGGDLAGQPVVGAGDTDGDGFDDFLVGAYGSGDDPYGAVYLVRGRADALTTSSLSSAATVWSAEPGFSGLGWGITGGGDLDGDGLDDFAAAAGRGADGAGRVYVVLGGSLSGGLISDAADTTLEVAGLPTTADRMGLAIGPDVDGDDRADMVVGAPRQGDSGMSFVLAGSGTWTSGAGAIEVRASAVVSGATAGDLAGAPVAILGDLDGDTLSEVAICAPHAAADDGALYIFAATSLVGSVSTADAPVQRHGSNGQAFCASLPQSPGDLNDDGFSDLPIGANAWGTKPETVYLFFGGP